MNKRANKSAKQHSANCLCQGLGPVLSDVLRRVGPPEEARHHFETARLEFLKGVRALLDARIERLANHHHKGAKIPVE
jgi:hypothetical protein